ncbi:hypothetical protein F5146DRAFT_209266 [Armillaria mellea]|nr:hypothetical protein F5146DRAFT_209266 [Armillaria mellea]
MHVDASYIPVLYPLCPCTLSQYRVPCPIIVCGPYLVSSMVTVYAFIFPFYALTKMSSFIQQLHILLSACDINDLVLVGNLASYGVALVDTLANYAQRLLAPPYRTSSLMTRHTTKQTGRFMKSPYLGVTRTLGTSSAHHGLRDSRNTRLTTSSKRPLLSHKTHVTVKLFENSSRMYWQFPFSFG